MIFISFFIKTCSRILFILLCMSILFFIVRRKIDHILFFYLIMSMVLNYVRTYVVIDEKDVKNDIITIVSANGTYCTIVPLIVH